MAIRVNTHNQLGSDRFTDATGWHVDESGYLHVTKTGAGNLATYHAAAWVSVEKVAEAAK